MILLDYLLLTFLDYCLTFRYIVKCLGMLRNVWECFEMLRNVLICTYLHKQRSETY